MPRRLLFLLLLTPLSCEMTDRLVHPGDRLRLERAGGGALLDVPVMASFCIADSTLTLVGAGRVWSAALALKTPWPADTAVFAIESLVGGAGSAALAARPLNDSVGSALVGMHGALRLADRTRAAGTLDLVAKRDSDTVHVVGTFAARAVKPGGCPAR